MKVAFEKVTPLKYDFSGHSCIPKKALNDDNFPASKNALSYAAVAPEVFKAYFLNFEGVKKTPFTYKPVSSQKPDYSPLNCDYTNIDEFCELYAKKIKSQLMEVSKSDVEKLAARLKRKTKASDELILNVLYGLSVYSSYNSLCKLRPLVEKYRISDFGLPYASFDSEVLDTSSNSTLSYVSKFKTQIANMYKINKYAIVLDDEFLNWLEKIKNSKNSKSKKIMHTLKKDLEKGKAIPIVLPGWDVKCSDGKYRSANMFFGTGHLEDIAFDVISRVQKGENLNDILYGDLSQRFKSIVEESIFVDRVSLPRKHVNINDVFDNLKTRTIPEKDIKYLIEEYIKSSGLELEDAAEFLKYLDRSTFVYSPDSISKELVELKTKIEKELSKKGQDEKDALYVVPLPDKSFTYIANAYAKLNGIESDRIVPNSSAKQWALEARSKNPKIILDDISASGETETKECTALEEYTKDSNIYYACLVLSSAAQRINSDINQIYMHKFIDLPSIRNYDAKEQIRAFAFESGFYDISSAVAFPYMIPDTNNDFSALLFSRLLQINTKEANKGLEISFSKREDFYRSLSIPCGVFRW